MVRKDEPKLEKEAFEEIEKRVSVFRQKSNFRRKSRIKNFRQVDNLNDMDIDEVVQSNLFNSQQLVQEQVIQQPKGKYEFINGRWA